MRHKFRWIYTTVAAALFSGLISLPASARDIAEIPPETLAALEENLKIAASDRSPGRYFEMIAPYMDRQEDSGLILIGNSEDHEVESARHFARLLKSKFNLRLILFAHWGHTSVPGFDGVITDQFGRPLANFSMKRVASPSTDRVMTTMKYAFSKIRRFSSFAGWMSVLTHQMNFPDGLNSVKLTPHQKDILYRSYHEIADMLSFLNIGGGRPEWVIIDAGAELDFVSEDAVEMFKTMPADIAADNKKVVIVRAKNEFYIFHKGRMRTQPAASCESLLKH